MQNILTLNSIVRIIFFSSIILPHELGIWEKEIFADSPSFPSQEISDDINDWNFLRNENMEPDTNATKCQMIQDDVHTPDIESIKYISDRKMLNATIWLDSPFQYEPNSTSFRPLATVVDLSMKQLKSPNMTLERLSEDRIKENEIYTYFNLTASNTNQL
jgi:hypothetical protein